MSEGESVPSPSERKARKIFFYLLAFILFGIVAGKIWYRYTFPYGWSHACSVGLSLGLTGYANSHDQWFPYGEATPEASLSLLYKDDPGTALWTLGGKNISSETIEAVFKRDGKLSPATCGWYYVEGLRENDNPELALAWDKVIGLGHNGQRLRGMMHEVIPLEGGHRFVSKKDWPEFIANQKKLLAQTIASRDTNAPPIRWSDEESLGPNRFSPK